MTTAHEPFSQSLGLPTPRLINGVLKAPTYVELQNTEVHGFLISDASMADRFDPSRRDELIWVSIYGEGRWLKPEEVLELAAALEATAHAHIERKFREQHRAFTLNHPEMAPRPAAGQTPAQRDMHEGVAPSQSDHTTHHH